jgi:dTDP-4-amino-4,6-dideoxygalactose transaminase
MALELAYAACPSPEVQVPAITFLATANAAALVGRRVVFRDCDARTGLTLGTPDPAAVFVTLGGQPVPGHWPGIVDACHGPLHHPPSAIATVLSFHPCKHVAAGEGGAVLTNEDGIAAFVRCLRDAGRLNGKAITVGTNGHLSELTAALARSQLARYQDGVLRRRLIAAQYDEAFMGLRHCYPVDHDPESARHLYQLLFPGPAARDRFRAYAASQGVGTQVHYRPIPAEPAWEQAGSFPGAESHANRVVSIPLYPSMTEDEMATVIRVVREAI